MIAAVIDTETNGLTKPSVSDLANQPRIIELAIALVEGGKIIEERNWLLDPGVLLTAEQTKHAGGITNEMLTGQPSFKAILPEFATLLDRAEACYAHNLPFDKALVDYEVLRSALGEYFADLWPKEMICTVQEFSHEFGHRPKLTELYERKLGKKLAQAHRAIEDVRALVEILVKEQLV
jgi:DNA polymerase III epsilon subunit-like protein